MMFRRAFLVFASIVASCSAHDASAEDWLQFGSEGVKPDRHIFLVDLDSIERGTSRRTARFAILSEKSRLNEPAQVITAWVMDCDKRDGQIVGAELRGKDGSLRGLVKEKPVGSGLGELERGPGMLGIVCDSRWPSGAHYRNGQTLTQIYRQEFDAKAHGD